MTRAIMLVVAVTLAVACSPAKNGPQTGSQTNWLRLCDAADDCGGLECLCGTCTASCDDTAACGDLAGAVCVASSHEGSIALCGSPANAQSLCLPQCEAGCGDGSSCIDGVCVPIAVAPAVHVAIDADDRQQTLVGFGASLAYADDAIAAYPHKTQLYDLVFEEAGLDAIRLRNRYEDGNVAALESAAEIVAAAAERLGREPFLIMTSGSPPAALKANGSRTCTDSAETCTLARPSGRFDYAGFAAYWRDSLEAYTRAGISPDYVSIQNNPNWVPSEDVMEACRFLPEEGTTQALLGDELVTYPGYREALVAVRAAIADLPRAPRLAAPEVSGLGQVESYAAALDTVAVDALALHLYGQDPADVDIAALEAARALATRLDRPLLQTEMQADGFATAVLMHYALTAGGAAAYLQNDLASWAPEVAEHAVVHLGSDGVERLGPYYALMHFAKRTDPGWVRVGAISNTAGLLSSAWLSPDESALTVVMINRGQDDLDAELVLSEPLRARFRSTKLERTVFESTERFADRGALSATGVANVPAGSILTISFTAED
jgi:glucuronoarabinoxylan endo-1,4-beta-xylanase